MDNDAYPIEAFRSILAWLGEDPSREGLIKTPKRFLKSLKEQCQGISQDPGSFLKEALIEIPYDEGMITLRDIPFESLCEHHLAPFIGVAHIAYIPHKKIVGLSKLARVVDALSHRLQIQERLTLQIAETIERILQPQGVYVVLEAEHQCMSIRGARKKGARLQTRKALGVFQENSLLKSETGI